jgi:two-component system, OmpR family, heavy metal sensor histidine kinase CusS
MRISFRTRLFVIATAIVAMVMVAVMMIGWSRVLAVEVERLDDRLCMEARRMATQPLRPDRIGSIESDIANKLRLPSTSQLMIKVDTNDGAPSVISTHWSSSVDTEKLVWTKALRPSDSSPRSQNDPQNNPQNDLQNDSRKPPPRDAQDELQQKPQRESRDGPPHDRRERVQRERKLHGACSLSSFTDQRREWRAAKFDSPAPENSSGRGIIATDVAATAQELQSAVKSSLGIVIPLALVLAALGAWLLSSLTMRPVNRLRAAMQGVDRNVLDERLSAQGEDREFAELIDAYNTMLERLDASFHQASRFSADAAHELRTPLTILQGRIEQAVNSSDRRTMQSDLVGMLDEVGRMSAITRKLLLLSRADAGRLALHLEPINLTELLDALIVDAQQVLEDQLLQSAIDINIEIDGDEILLRQLFNNLISNAVRYCPAGGWIKVSAQALTGGIEVCFANRSHPISFEDRRRFFDRFYRGDAEHNRYIEGSGLGLSLAREIARAHGGDLTLLASPLDEVVIELWLLRASRSTVAAKEKSSSPSP